MAPIKLRDTLQITVRGLRGVVGHYGAGSQTYHYYEPHITSESEANKLARRIWDALQGDTSVVVDGRHFPDDVVGPDGVLDLTQGAM